MHRRPVTRGGVPHLDTPHLAVTLTAILAVLLLPVGLLAAAEEPAPVTQTVTIEVLTVPRSVTLAGSVTFVLAFDEEVEDARRSGSPTISYENPSDFGAARIVVEPLGADGEPMTGAPGSWPFGATLIVGIRPGTLGAGNGQRLAFGNFLSFGESAGSTTERSALITAIPGDRVVGPIALNYQLDGTNPGIATEATITFRFSIEDDGS